jgi:hypothetical protein
VPPGQQAEQHLLQRRLLPHDPAAHLLAQRGGVRDQRLDLPFSGGQDSPSWLRTCAAGRAEAR